MPELGKTLRLDVVGAGPREDELGEDVGGAMDELRRERGGDGGGGCWLAVTTRCGRARAWGWRHPGSFFVPGQGGGGTTRPRHADRGHAVDELRTATTDHGHAVAELGTPAALPLLRRFAARFIAPSRRPRVLART